ncbi:MAG: hypothetical protein IMW91_01370 [Firmicutes bacterium]|nr:hypothetical protein [Bacillota bacterium]
MAAWQSWQMQDRWLENPMQDRLEQTVKVPDRPFPVGRFLRGRRRAEVHDPLIQAITETLCGAPEKRLPFAALAQQFGDRSPVELTLALQDGMRHGLFILVEENKRSHRGIRFEVVEVRLEEGVICP